MKKMNKQFRPDVIMNAYKRAIMCENGNSLSGAEGIALIICMLSSLMEDQKSNPEERVQQLRRDINIFLLSPEVKKIGEAFIESNEDNKPDDDRLN